MIVWKIEILKYHWPLAVDGKHELRVDELLMTWRLISGLFERHMLVRSMI